MAHGNYTGGWIIMDKDDPTVLKQRSDAHLFTPTMDYEIGGGKWPTKCAFSPLPHPHPPFPHARTPFCAAAHPPPAPTRPPRSRFRTIFTTSVVPLPNEGADTFLVWYGAADANVAWAKIRVSHA